MTSKCQGQSPGRVAKIQSNKLTVNTANNMPLAITGVVLLKFSLANNRSALLCPFLVTDTVLTDCIVGTNIIQSLYTNQSKENFAVDIASAVGKVVARETIVSAMEVTATEKTVVCSQTVTIKI